MTNVFSDKCLTKEQTKYVYDKVESGDELKVRKAVLSTKGKPLLPKTDKR